MLDSDAAHAVLCTSSFCVFEFPSVLFYFPYFALHYYSERLLKSKSIMFETFAVFLQGFLKCEKNSSFQETKMSRKLCFY